MPLNLPILLTWARIVLIPMFVGVYYLPDAWMPLATKNLVATLFFIVAAVTDWFDGYLARRWNQTSQFGAFLDPVADKLMVTAALLVLLEFQRVEEWVALIIIGREIAISALREWMAQIGAGKSVAVSSIGKIKTAAQMVAIPLLLFNGSLLGVMPSVRIGTWLIYVAAVLTVISMLYYMRQAWPQISERSA